MLKRWLSTAKLFVRFGVAADRVWAAGFRLRTSGRASRTNGRIWEAMIGVASLASGSTAWLDRSISGATGVRSRAAGPSTSAKRWTLLSVLVAVRSALGSWLTALVMFWFCEAKAR